ncbi:hypothetical protein [Paenibacillus xerothermodurans]|nr:hypothetical protein [Paenibacillus xerothermodurans]
MGYPTGGAGFGKLTSAQAAGISRLSFFAHDDDLPLRLHKPILRRYYA